MLEHDETPLPLEQQQHFVLVRRAADLLLAVGVLLAIASVVHSYLSATIDGNQLYNPDSVPVDLPFKVHLWAFLESFVVEMAWSAVVIAASFALRLGVARGLSLTPFVGYEQATAPAVMLTSPDSQSERRTPPIANRDDDMWRPKL